MAIAVRQCSATTKAGTACSAPPLEGMDTCMAHAPAEVRESRGFVAANGKGGRPRVAKPIEVMQQRIEERIDEVLRAYFDALEAEVYSLDGEALGPRHETRMKAADALLDRVYGRPTQRSEVEHSGEIGVGLLLGELPNDDDANTKFEEGAA